MPKIKLPSTAEKDSKYARLTARQWAEVEGLWTRGEATLSQLSERYGKDISAFTKHFKKRGLTKGSRASEVRQQVEAALDQQIANEAEITTQRIKETKDDGYKMAKALGAAIFAEVVKCKQEGRPIATATANIKALEIALAGVSRSTDLRWKILGLDRGEHIDVETLPELIVGQLTDEEIQSIQKSQEEDPLQPLDDELDILDEEDADDSEEVVESGFEDDDEVNGNGLSS